APAAKAVPAAPAAPAAAGTAPIKPAAKAPAGVAKPATPTPAPAKAAAKAPAAVPVKPAAEEMDLDFTADLVVKNPFGGGDVAVKQLDFTDLPSASPTQARAAAKDAELTEHLVEGSWVEVREKGEEDAINVRPARLTFVSPMKTSYIFVDRNGT